MNRQELNIELYKKLYLIRAAEQSIRENYSKDEMKTPMHMSAGEEAICAGVCQALGPADQVVGTYRTHGLYLARTGETDRFFAEMYGRETGMAKGKGGSMHLSAPAQGMICTSAIVGTSIPVAAGAAFAHKLRGTKNIVASFFGDGAIDEGVFWESLNAACAMRLPILFVCEDNGYAVHATTGERHGYESIAEVVSRFNCEVYSEDTTDAEIIHGLAARAIDQIRSSARPAFLYLKYFRYLEHVGVNEDFNQGYRRREDAEPWFKIDPVSLMRARLVSWISEDGVSRIERSIRNQVDESVQRAVAAPYAGRAETYRNVLA